MKLKICSLFLLLLISCNSKTDNSFKSLSESFNAWYFKNKPVTSTFQNQQKYDGEFRLNDFKSNENYILDLNRFYFELTQIDAQKLNQISELEYNRIKKTILKLIYIEEEIKEQEWRPYLKLHEIGSKSAKIHHARG